MGAIKVGLVQVNTCGDREASLGEVAWRDEHVAMLPGYPVYVGVAAFPR